MRTIVADVGGTNTRMAQAASGAVVPGSARWFRNDDFARFEDVLAVFHAGPVDAVCVAIAGPVMPGHAALTNRDWRFDAGALSNTLGGARVRIINDLAAVGHALPHLDPGALRSIVAGQAADAGQALVVGIGTGFNVSVVQGGTVFLAELGHATLPARVRATLAGHVAPDKFGSIETLFAGAGVRRLHRALGGADLSSDVILRDHPATMTLYCAALAAMCTEMTYAYLPLGGIYLNGGLARAVSELPGAAQALAGARVRDAFGGTLADIPVWVVVDDTAALAGCAAVLG